MTQYFAIFILLFIPFVSTFASSEIPHPGLRSGEQATFLFKEAIDAEKKGNTELAIENYQSILKNYPESAHKKTIYQNLLELYSNQKKYTEVLALGKEALLDQPTKNQILSIKLMRAYAELQLGRTLQTKIIVEEILKTKPDSKARSIALLLKAEALSQLGKHKEAMASLDAAKGDEKFADSELKIRARTCSAQKRAPKQETLDYVHEKNLCFKESAALSKPSPAKDAAAVWCDRFQGFEEEFQKIKMEPFTREKLNLELSRTKAIAAPWECK